MFDIKMWRIMRLWVIFGPYSVLRPHGADTNICFASWSCCGTGVMHSASSHASPQFNSVHSLFAMWHMCTTFQGEEQWNEPCAPGWCTVSGVCGLFLCSCIVFSLCHKYCDDKVNNRHILVIVTASVLWWHWVITHIFACYFKAVADYAFVHQSPTLLNS